MSDPVLELSGVTRAYGTGPARIEVLRGVDLTLVPGELVALTAPSGAGKSTLLHLCGLLDRPDTGHLRVLGQDTGALDERARTALRRDRIGFVYQFHHLLPEFSARENIVLPQQAAGRSRAAAEERADALLAEVGLAQRTAHRPAALSGGEAQRVALCRALANGPALLLADEPTGNLDPETAEAVFDTMVRAARATGLAAMVATHNPDLARRLDRRLSLTGGRLVPS